MDQLIYPSAMLFTETGTFIVRPQHGPGCPARTGGPCTGIRCTHRRYLALVDQMLALGNYQQAQRVEQKEVESHESP